MATLSKKKTSTRSSPRKRGPILDAFPDRIDLRDWFYEPTLALRARPAAEARGWVTHKKGDHMRHIQTALALLALLVLFGWLGNAESRADDDITAYTSAVVIVAVTPSHDEQATRLRQLPASVLPFAIARANTGDPEAAWLAGKMYALGVHTSRDLAKAIKMYRDAAAQKYAGGLFELGDHYRAGIGVESDQRRALELYREAAQQGSVAAMHNLAYALSTGDGVSKNRQEADQWFRRAAMLGFGAAAGNLGFNYLESVPPNYTEAAVWYTRGDILGDARSSNLLGMLYAKGLGVAQDYHRAAILFEKAASKGLGDAMENLAVLYHRGLGVPKDPAKEAKWRASAERAGTTPDSRRRLEFDLD